MINAEQITARLRMMSDSDLQRFAEMNKKDPYLFPLAFNESNMRKKVRMAGAAQQAAPQPPVNEQAVAAMTPAQLPENQGIGVLNPNLQFADGGLVAFAAGGAPEDGYEANDDAYSGEMPTYAYGGAVRFADGGATEEWPQNMFERPKPRYLFGPTMMSNRQMVGERELEAATKKADEQRAAEELNPETWRYKDVATKAAPPLPKADPSLIPAPGVLPAPVAPRVAVPARAAAPTNLVSDIKKLYGGAADEEQRIAEQRIAEYQKGRPAPETFEERRKLLEESGADVEKQQRMDEGLAWLTFASKVMTPGMNPIQALVEGTAAGTSQYAAAQKDLKKAERERKMGLAALAEAQRSADRQDYEALAAYKQKASERADNVRGAETSAIASAMNISFQEASQIRRDEINRAAAAANVNAQIAAQERMANVGLTRDTARAKAQEVQKLKDKALDIWTDQAKRAMLPKNIKTMDDLLVYLQGLSGGATSDASLKDFTIENSPS